MTVPHQESSTSDSAEPQGAIQGQPPNPQGQGKKDQDKKDQDKPNDKSKDDDGDKKGGAGALPPPVLSEAKLEDATSSDAPDSDLEQRLRNAEYRLAGDLVSGDKFVMMLGGREKAPMQPLGDQLSDPVRHAFVEPRGWPEIRGSLFERRIVILRADPHQGKVAAAIRMLQAQPDRIVYKIDQDVELTRLTTLLDDANNSDPLPAGAGFLLCEPERWTEVRGWMLQQLAAVLEKIDARFVLTLSTEARLADEDVQEYVVALGAARPHAEILERHLAWRLDDEALARRILADDDVTGLVSEYFAQPSSLKAAADLAVYLSQERTGSAVNVERVRLRWDQKLTEDFDIWFSGLSDIPTRCLAIALAVLNGLPYDMVMRYAAQLEQRLDGPPDVVNIDGTPLPPWHDPFRRTRREWLRTLRAGIRETTVRGRYGWSPAEVLEYSDNDYPTKVLTHVWRQYDIQLELLDWLTDVAASGNKDVQVWAGVAFGVLARNAFDFVCTMALAPMSIDEHSPASRDVVAYALRVAAADTTLRPLVVAMVSALYANETNVFAQATAARAHGVSLGRLGASQALDALDRLAIINRVVVASAIGASLGDLVQQDEQNNAPLVLDRVASWLNDRRRGLTAQYVFLQLSTMARDESEQSRVAWPALLLLADRHVPLRHLLIGMWRHVLNSGTYPEITATTLSRWAAWAEDDGDVRASFCRMLLATAEQSERTRTLIRRHVAGWRALDNLQPKPKTAYAVEAALDARSVVA